MKNRTKSGEVCAMVFVILIYGKEGDAGGCIHWRSPDLVVTLRKNCTICSQSFKTETLIMPPYSGTRFQTLMRSVIEACCESCPGFHQRFMLPRFYLDSFGLSRVLLHADFVYPVFAYSNSIEVYGNYYIPFYDPAGAIFITGVLCVTFLRIY